MKKTTSLLISICIIVSIFAGAGVTAGAAGETYTFGINGTFDYSEASEVYSKLNNLRKQRSLPELVLDEQLMSAAMQRAAEISLYFSHTRPNGDSWLTVLPSGYTTAAENIAIGQANASGAMNSWENSQGHFENMTSSNKTAVGIGCFYQSDGTKCWVQLFTGGMTTKSVNVSGKRTETRNVTAIADYLSLGLQPNSAVLDVGKTETFSLYNTVNEGWKQASATKIIAKLYETNDSQIATVNSSGTVTGISAGSTVLKLGVGSDLYAQANIVVTGSGQANEIQSSMFVIDLTTAIYTGTAIEKAIISDLVKNTDYTVTYSNNINVGTATITINGIGRYSGTLSYVFSIENPSEEEKIALVGAANGTIGANTFSPSSGERITVTVTPAEGYRFENLMITDRNGKNITYMQTGVNRYSFEFEGINVTVSATFLPKSSGREIPFVDVTTNNWFYEPVKFVYENKLFGGTSPDTFSPDVAMSRGMMVTVLHRLAGTPASAGNTFTDVPANIWYTDAVSWAASKNIVSGIGNNLFAPDSNITREQMAVMLFNYARIMKLDLPAIRAAGVFADSNQISSWAKEAVDVMYRAGIINGKGENAFDPGGNATRAEVATMFMNFIKAI